MSKRALALADIEPGDLTVDQKLAAIDRDRASWNAELASLPARELILLEADADDAAFASLDRVRRRAEIGLAKTDLRERGVLAQARSDREANVAAAWAEQRGRYRAAAGAYVAAVQEAQRLEGNMLEVGRAIHGSSVGQTLPTPLRVIADQALRDFALAIDNMAVAPHVDPVEAERHPMAMLQRHGAFNAGEMVTYTATEGWPLVDAGIARWAAGVRAPRRPVGAGPAIQGLTATRDIMKASA